MVLENSAGAVIFRKKEGVIYYLLLNYSAGHWDFPKGNIEKREGLKDTVKREVEEETGIEGIVFLEDFKEKIDYFYKKDGKTVYKTVVFFLARTEEKNVKISFEHKGFKWLSYNTALEELTFDNARKVLEKAHAFLLKIL